MPRERELPLNVGIPDFDAYQVRIVRDGHEYSATFAWSRYGTAEAALAQAVAWRDAMLEKLPPAAIALGSFRCKSQSNKRSCNRVGVSRYIGIDRRKLGSPGYLRFAVNWTDASGKSRVTSFQVGRVGKFKWEDELHAACTAEAFRTNWEFCQSSGEKFDADFYQDWKDVCRYPFNLGVNLE